MARRRGTRANKRAHVRAIHCPLPETPWFHRQLVAKRDTQHKKVKIPSLWGGTLVTMTTMAGHGNTAIFMQQSASKNEVDERALQLKHHHYQQNEPPSEPLATNAFDGPAAENQPIDGPRVLGDHISNPQSAYDNGLHRRRTLYLVRHGEAVHNVLEAQAQAEAKLEAQAQNLSPEETLALMEERREAVLQDVTLRDAPLTDKGRQQARECGTRFQELMDQGKMHPPSEAMVSPLHRTLETCQILLDTINPDIKAHIRGEIQERQTQYPPDTPSPRSALFRYTSKSDRFVINNIDSVPASDVEDECNAHESKEMLRERAAGFFHLLMEMNHRHVLVVSHKGYLRELERGLLGLTDSPLFGNAELRVYRVVFTKGKRELESVERLV